MSVGSIVVLGGRSKNEKWRRICKRRVVVDLAVDTNCYSCDIVL